MRPTFHDVLTDMESCGRRDRPRFFLRCDDLDFLDGAGAGVVVDVVVDVVVVVVVCGLRRRRRNSQ